MARRPPPIPLSDPLVTPDRLVSQQWIYYFTDQGDLVNASSQGVGNTGSLTSQSAAIATTNLPVLVVTAGLYRVTYYAEITQAAGSSSSLTVTVGWTHNSKSFTQSGAAITGNTTTTQQNGIFNLLVDGNTAMTYETAYSSSGTPSMEYELLVTVESVTL